MVILPAAHWNYNSQKASVAIDFVPDLEDLVDALIDSLLDCPEDSKLRTHLSVQRVYLYGNVQQLKSPGFAERLLHEHRQYHYDACAGMRSGTVQFAAHQRKIRRAL